MLNSLLSWFSINILLIISTFVLSRRIYEARDTCGSFLSQCREFALKLISALYKVCMRLNSNWCSHPKSCCLMSYIDWKYLSNKFPVLSELSGLALNGAYMAVWPSRREGKKDNDSSAVLDNRKFVDLICTTPSFKRFPFINSSWFGRGAGGGNTLLKEPIPE